MSLPAAHVRLPRRTARPDSTVSGGRPSASVPPAAAAASASPSRDTPPELPPLLGYRATWQVLGAWTLCYAAASWATAYVFSLFDPSGPAPFLHGLNRVVYAVLWTGNILVAILVTERFPVVRARAIRRSALHVAVTLVVTVCWGVSAYYICLLIVPGWRPLGVGRMLATTAQNVIFGYGLIVLLVHIVQSVRAHRQHEVELLTRARLATEAQLNVLKMELQPHFLFNALHAVSSLIHSDPHAANDTLVLLSDMLRHSVQTSRVQEVSLREELATLQRFTQIAEVRFGDRLRLGWHVAPETLEAAVPHMLIQPFIENAIKHGLEVQSDAGRITVSSLREREELVITIEDDGPGPDTPSPRRGAGVGIANTRARLEQLYGPRYTLNLSGLPTRGTRVEIRLPFARTDAARHPAA